MARAEHADIGPKSDFLGVSSVDRFAALPRCPFPGVHTQPPGIPMTTESSVAGKDACLKSAIAVGICNSFHDSKCVLPRIYFNDIDMDNDG